MVPMSSTYEASRPVSSDTPDAIAAAVRAATKELSETLQSKGIDVAYEDIARLGHSESWDEEGQRWVQVVWDAEEGSRDSGA